MTKHCSRRSFAAGAAAVVASLAGCTGDGGDGSGGGDGNGGMDDGSEDDSMDATRSVAVGPEGSLVFSPDSLAVAAGTTVEFNWGSSGHNIRVESQPDGADWSGVEELRDEGATHAHTFETTGEYAYYCQPHRGSGMEATITVTES